MEFGSDFHYMAPCLPVGGRALSSYYPGALLLGNGRQCLVHLIRICGWKRLWVPAWFCHEVLTSVAAMTGVQWVIYPDGPEREFPTEGMARLPFRPGDALLRMNYFGCRGFRSPEGIPVPVIEDHSHDLLGPWALNSRADWCIASLRKSLPIPDGGMLWSPKGHPFAAVDSDPAHAARMAERWEAMRLKAAYLAGEPVEKASFRSLYLSTEEYFDIAQPSAVDPESASWLQAFDIAGWYARKRENWARLRTRLGSVTLTPESDACTPFSFVLVADSQAQRDAWKRRMIAADIYPAVLWELPEAVRTLVPDEKWPLSVHCDGRYSLAYIEVLADRLEMILFQDRSVFS